MTNESSIGGEVYTRDDGAIVPSRRELEWVCDSKKVNTFHYYCDIPPAPLWPMPAEKELEITKSQLTESHIRSIISREAEGQPPYTLIVPREILWDAHAFWKFPTSLITIVPKPNREDVYPVDTAELYFQNSIIVIHALRVVESTFRLDTFQIRV